jgi:hypothetical protein
MAAVFAIVFQALSFFNGATVTSPSHGGATGPADLGIYGSFGS